MVWIHLIETKIIDEVDYPPCNFNPLCTCSKVIPDLGIVRCKDIHLSHIPNTINNSKVFMLHMENNGLRHIEPFFFQNTGILVMCRCAKICKILFLFCFKVYIN